MKKFITLLTMAFIALMSISLTSLVMRILILHTPSMEHGGVICMYNMAVSMLPIR